MVGVMFSHPLQGIITCETGIVAVSGKGIEYIKGLHNQKGFD
jgi:hypothetical protein